MVLFFEFRLSFVILLVQLGLAGFSAFIRVSRVSRMSKVTVGIRISIKIRVSLV